MSSQLPVYAPDDPVAVHCYRAALQALKAANVEFLIGGAYSFARYTTIPRHTKDLDLFLRKEERAAALRALSRAGYQTEVTYSHWLAKARCGDHFIDVIHSSGNGIATVDAGWFAHSLDAVLLGERVRLCPPEESIWSKSFVMERDRFDGADIAHIFREMGDRLDWRRLLNRFGEHWRVLYSHVILFGYAYPGEQERIPAWVRRELAGRVAREEETPPEDERLCRGTMLSATQYLPDVELWGYRDSRLPPHGTMAARQATEWTNGILAGR